MSVIRFVMVEGTHAESALLPSSSIPGILFAVGCGATDILSFWEHVSKVEPGLSAHFQTNLDPIPLLEGRADGLLVISWDFFCIESFQSYMPVRLSGTVVPHTGLERSRESAAELPYCIDDTWHVIDHHFEESRH